MGLGRILTRSASQLRSTEITVRDTITNQLQQYVITDNIAPDFSATTFYRGAMSVPGAWRATTLLAGLFGLLPWHAYRSRPGQPAERLPRTPPLLEQPNPPHTRMTTFSAWGLDYYWHGNAVGVIAARNPGGWPTAAIPVAAESVQVRRVTRFSDSPLPVGAVEYNIGNLTLAAQDVIHIMGPSAPGALRGVGVLEAHLSTLDLAREQIRQAQSISRHGVPTGVLKVSNPDATVEDLAAAKAAWLTAQRDRTVAALNAVTEFQPLSWNPEEMQLVEARRYTLTDLELMFGLPPGWLGGMNSARQYSNIEQDAVNLLKFSLGGPLTQFEQTLSLHMPRGTEARANLDALLRPDTLTRYQAHAIATGGQPFMTVDEVRAFENRGPMPETEKPPEPDPFADEDTMEDDQP